MKTIVFFGLVLGALSAAGKVYFAEVGGKVVLDCGSKGFKSKLEWHHKKLIHRVDAKSGVLSRGEDLIQQRSKKLQDTQLEISNVMENDAGTFTCILDNNGRHEHTLIVVSVSVLPSGYPVILVGTEATLECQIRGLSVQPTVKWKKPDGSVQTTNKVKLNPAALSDNGTWTCDVEHADSTFTKIINIHVKEPDLERTSPSIEKPNDKPITKDTVPILFGDGPGLLGLVWWVWVAIGAGGLVVITLIIVILVVKKRNRRRKRRFLRMKQAQLLQKQKKYCQCVSQTAAAKPQQGRRREKPSALPLQPLLQE